MVPRNLDWNKMEIKEEMAGAKQSRRNKNIQENYQSMTEKIWEEEHQETEETYLLGKESTP